MSFAYVIPVSIIIQLYSSILRQTVRTNLIRPSVAAKQNNKRNIKVFQNILILLHRPSST